MKRFQWAWLTSCLAVGGLLAVGGTLRSSPAAQPPVGELMSTARAPLLLDATPVKPVARAAARQLTWRYPRPVRPVGMNVRMEILVGGKPLPTVQYAGKTYLPVPHVGAEYEVRICNDGPRRITAVVSVDGLSVINGKPASESHPGYIVAPYSSVVIPGWRRSLDKVAAFRFVERGKSYAGQVGHPENIGVIGLVAFEEQVWRPRYPLERVPSKAAARPTYGAVGSIGTEYGREVDSRIYYVPFVRSRNRRAITFYYDTVEALRAAGVPVDSPSPVPFPGDDQFVPPPPGYKGQ